VTHARRQSVVAWRGGALAMMASTKASTTRRETDGFGAIEAPFDRLVRLESVVGRK
jgi:hypothetical protein